MKPNKKVTLSLFAMAAVGSSAVAAPVASARPDLPPGIQSIFVRQDCKVPQGFASFGARGVSHGNWIVFTEGYYCGAPPV